MEVSIVERKPVTIAYLRHEGPYGESVSDFWQKVMYPWMISNQLIGPARYGISQDDPITTLPEKCRYDAAVEVTKALVHPGEAVVTTMPGGKYAVTKFSGKASEVGAAWNRILRDWLPTSGWQLDARPFLEYYGEDVTFDAESGIVTCNIEVPVTKA